MMPFVDTFYGYVFPRTVNETKKAIILCISYHFYERVQGNYQSIPVNGSSLTINAAISLTRAQK